MSSQLLQFISPDNARTSVHTNIWHRRLGGIRSGDWHSAESGVEGKYKAMRLANSFNNRIPAMCGETHLSQHEGQIALGVAKHSVADSVVAGNAMGSRALE